MAAADRRASDRKPSALDYQLVDQMHVVADHSYVIKHLLGAGVCAVLFGESGAGKSHLAVDMAIAVALGRPFFGHKTQQGAVLYLAGEGADGLTNRIMAARKFGSLADSTPLALVRKSVVLDLDEHIDPLRVVETAKALAKKVGEPVRLIVVDTLARSLAGDENSSEDMGRFVKACEMIRESTGATVLIVHHSGKDAARGARGHSSLRAAIDTELLVEGRKNPRRLSVTKQRDLPIVPAMQFDLEAMELARDADGEPVTACVVRESGAVQPGPPRLGKQQAILLKELERRQQASHSALVWTDFGLREIGRELDMHKSTARDAVEGLLEKQLLCPTTDGFGLTQRRDGRDGMGRTTPIRPEQLGTIRTGGL